MTKQCFKCMKDKDINDFYKHPMTSDGRLGKCKECAKADVTANRLKNIDRIREYDRSRGRTRPAHGIKKEYRERFPRKYKAQTMVGNAIRSGKLHRESCVICSSDFAVHGHHDDYSKPLNVRWLCAVCHADWHKNNGEALNP